MYAHKSHLLLALALTLLPSAQAQDHEESHLLTKPQIWGFGFLAGLGISLIGFVAAIILVCAKKCASPTCFEATIKFLFALACGALLGDAIIHIAAEAYANEQTKNPIVSLIFILSILCFLLIDRAFHAFGIAHTHWVDEVCSDKEHEHEHGEHNHPKGKNDSKVGDEQMKVHNHAHGGHQCEGILMESGKVSGNNNDQNENPEMLASSSSVIQSCNDKEKGKTGCLRQFEGKESSGYLNFLGSLIHNFIDGIALGVSFATGDPKVFVPVLVAIIAHEIPRELGDVAILLKSEFNEVQTILCNGTINLISLVGVLIGLAIINLSDVVKSYIMIFVAGNFVYIASDIWRHIFKNKQKRQNLL